MNGPQLLPTKLASTLSSMSMSTSSLTTGCDDKDDDVPRHGTSKFDNSDKNDDACDDVSDSEKTSTTGTTTTTTATTGITQIQATSLLVSFWRWKESQTASHRSTTTTTTSSTAAPPTTVPLLSVEDGYADGVLLQTLLSKEQIETLESSHIIQKGIDALALRSRFIDDWLLLSQQQQQQQDHENFQQQSTTPTTAIDQEDVVVPNPIVNLGAGMDARPYRLRGLSTVPRLYVEVDSDKTVLDMKHSVLQKQHDMKLQCHVVQVGADLSNPQLAYEAIVAAVNNTENADDDHLDGRINPSTNIDWVAEGLMAYLEPHQRISLLEMTYRNSGPKSRMIMTVLDVDGAHNFESMGLKIPWKQLSTVSDVETAARSAGWNTAKIIPFDELYDTYCTTTSPPPPGCEPATVTVDTKVPATKLSYTRPVLDLTGYVLMTLEK